MKVLFWGTPAYAVPSLEALFEAGHQLVGVVTQPDRRRGRGSALISSPVKARSLDLAPDVPVFMPQRIRRDPQMQAELAALGADISVVVAFGQLLPPEVLQQPPFGCWNGHGSLLPRWRGAGPIQWSLIEGDSETGVGIMAMEVGLDTGPVLLERTLPIGLLDTAADLSGRLSALTAELLVEALPRIEAAGPGPEAERLARLQIRRQGDEGITLARLLTKEDYRIDWNGRALAIHRRIMGLHPGAYCMWSGKRLKLLATEPLVLRLAAQLSPDAAELSRRDWPKVEPGSVLERVRGVGLVIATSGCPLLLRSAQLEGKGPTSGDGLIQQLNA